ncbi:uncharacterized protein TNCV_1992281 [Trichonephila clavipes]|nr:uncharacterized protein TNCV_1992281 [Trichonephila clavipes]
MGCHCLQYTVTPSIDPWPHDSPVFVHDILRPHVLLLMQRLPRVIFQQSNARPHTARVSQDCIRTVTTLSRSLRIEHIWDNLGWRVGHPTSLNELETNLQQIWNEMSQYII